MTDIMNNKREKSGTLKNTEIILAVKKDGVDYSWFTVVTKSGKQLTVHGVKWVVDSSVKESKIMYLKEKKKEGYENEVNKCEIVGNKKQIQNIMATLGYGTPDKPNDLIFALSFSDAVRSLQSCVYQMETLLNKGEQK